MDPMTWDDIVERADEPEPEILYKYRRILEDGLEYEYGFIGISSLYRDEFMAEARKSQVVVATGEPSVYGTIMLKAGVLDLTEGGGSQAPVQPLLQKIGTVPNNSTCCDRGFECLYFSCVDAILNPKIFSTLLDEQPFSAGGQNFYYREYSTKMPLTSSEEMSTEDPITIPGLSTIPTIPASTPPGYIEGIYLEYDYTNDNGDVATIMHAIHDQEHKLYVHIDMMEGPNLSLDPCNEQYVWKGWNQCIIPGVLQYCFHFVFVIFSGSGARTEELLTFNQQPWKFAT